MRISDWSSDVCSSDLLTKVTANTSDVDLLPSATARVKFPGGFQARFGYSRTMRRPDFGSLNPVRKLNYVGNPILINNGSQGNHDLQPQKSDSLERKSIRVGKEGVSKCKSGWWT